MIRQLFMVVLLVFARVATYGQARRRFSLVPELKWKRLLPLGVTVAVTLAPFPLLAAESSGGIFVGRIIVEWLEEDDDEDRLMRLVEPFEYWANDGTEWKVPAGALIDGASIPQAFWTLVGSPFVGDYRRASVVHDYYCKTRGRPWQDVHRVFYEAMLSGGVPRPRATVLYAAVLAGGPQWDSSDSYTETPSRMPELSVGQLETLIEWTEANDPDLDDLEDHIRETVWE